MPDIYQLRNVKSGEFILFGKGKCCAYRMCSLLPAPYGQGTRNNSPKRSYVLSNIDDIEYRTLAFSTEEEMTITEKEVKASVTYLFNT
jgi:hypothetical protein